MKSWMENRRKKDGSERQRVFPAVFFIFLAVLSLLCMGKSGTVFAASGQAEVRLSVEMDVSYGFGDTAKGDRYLPIRVMLDNLADSDFNGTVEILTTESSMEVYRYDYSVELKPLEKREELYYIPLGVRSDQLFVTLRGTNGAELVRKRLKLNISKEVSDVFVGVLSKTPEELSFLNEVGIRYGSIRTKVVNLNKNNVPEDAKGLDQLDLLIVTDYDLNELSDIQQNAIMSWAEGGGTILFGGGDKFKESMGKFASEFLDFPIGTPALKQVNLGAEYSQSAPQDSVLELVCADMTLKNGSILISGDDFPLLSFAHRKKGRVAAAAFEIADIGGFCEEHPGFLEKFLMLVFGETRINELSQMDYYGFSSLYFSVQGLVNTGNVDRLPNVTAYTVTIVIYILLIGPGIYLLLKKKSLQRFYIAGVAICAVFFTIMIYMMGVKTRFRGPFFTYATILDASETAAEEETFINVRSPFNKPFAVKLSPDYIVRPITKSYYYDSVTAAEFTGEENYRTAIVNEREGTELRVRDTAAFTPKMFTLNKPVKNDAKLGLKADVSFFDGRISGTVTNNFDYRLENAALILYGKAVLIGDLEPGETVSLDGRENINYPLSYAYVFAQSVTGADQYDKADISDEKYMLAQDRTRLLSFYMESNINEYSPDARFVAFSPKKNEKEFLVDKNFITEGITLVTSSVEVQRTRDGVVYRSALEQEPNVISGSYQPRYNSMYTGEPSEPAVIEYSLGNDLELSKLTFEELSPEFIGNQKYPYLAAFQGKMYFYNYNTGHNDLVEEKKKSYTAEELKPYLSPSNTITIKYVSESTGEYGWDKLLPLLYVTGKEK